jgi:hypothetical protein
VVRQTRNDDVMTAQKQRARETLELRRTRGHAMKEDDGTGTPLAMNISERSPFFTDAIVISCEQGVETLGKGGHCERP